MPRHPLVSRWNDCDHCSGSLAPTSTKYPLREWPKNSSFRRFSASEGNMARMRADSSLRARARAAHDVAGAVTGDELDQNDLATFRLDHLASHHLVGAVIGALDQHLRPHAADQ